MRYKPRKRTVRRMDESRTRKNRYKTRKRIVRRMDEMLIYLIGRK